MLRCDLTSFFVKVPLINKRTYVIESLILSFKGMYDGNDHYPKLLPCSHTVCLQCLHRIVATFARDTGQFRCPICRELITIPRGGVSALPPSFLVNQLLDLMARQRREVIPKCSTHQTQVRRFFAKGGKHLPSYLYVRPSIWRFHGIIGVAL